MKNTIRWVFLALGAGLIAWLVWPGDEASPRDTFELGLKYIRDGDFDRVWSLYTPRRQEEMEDEFAVQEKTLVREIQTGGPNLGVLDQFTQRQYGLSPKATVDTPAPELFARNLERTREQRLSLRIIDDVVIRGDVATFRVREGEGPPQKWTLVRQDDGRWLIDETENGPPR